MKKKIFAMLMTLIMAIGCFGSVAFAAGNGWAKLADMPQNKVMTKAHHVDGKIYLVGEYKDTSHVYNMDSVMLIYDIATDEWSYGVQLMTPLYGTASVTVDNEIYFIGGNYQNGLATGHVQIYNTETNRWRSGAKMPTEFNTGDAAYLNDKIYVLNPYKYCIEVFSVIENKWLDGIEMEPMPGGYSSIHVIGDSLYILPTASKRAVYKYDTIDGTMEQLADIRITSNMRSTTVNGNDIYISYIDNIEIFDTEKNEWRNGPGMPEPLNSMSSIFVNGVFYMMGGRNGSQSSLSLYAYTGEDDGSENNTLSVLLEEDETTRLIVTDRFTDNTDYNWASSDNGVAQVDANGIVTAIAPGLTYITAESKTGSYTDSIPVRVVEIGEAAGERLAVFLDPGEVKNLYLNDDYTNITWTSMDSAVVTVDAMGKITGVAEGLAIVQAEYGSEVYHIYVRVS